MEKGTPLNDFNDRHLQIKNKLATVELTPGSETKVCWDIGRDLNITGPTVKNYIEGKIKDGYLAESIFSLCKLLKLVKK